MQYSIVFATLASASLAFAQSTLTVNTPTSLVQCQPAALSWTGGQAPYFVSIIPGGQPSATPLESFPQTSETTLTWTVDIPSGTSITVQIRDASGTLNYAQAVTVQAGTSTNCANSAASSGGAAASTPAAGAASSAASHASGASSAASSAGSAASSAAGSARTGASSAAASAVSSAAHSGASAASSAAPAASSGASNSGAEKVGAGIFTVAAAALLALFA